MGQRIIAETQTKGGQSRPRAFDLDVVLGQALETCWTTGYFGTSIDELSLAIGLSPASRCAGFWGRAITLYKGDRVYCSIERVEVERAISAERPLGQGLRALVRNAIASYVADPLGPRGCFMASVAVSDAASDLAVRFSNSFVIVRFCAGLREPPA